MRYLLAILLLLPSVACAENVKMIECWNTEKSDLLASVCEAKLNGSPAYTILSKNGVTKIYHAGNKILIGNDSNYGTIKYKVNLKFAGNISSNGSIIFERNIPDARMYLGYSANDNKIVYLMGSSEIDFSTDLRRK